MQLLLHSSLMGTLKPAMTLPERMAMVVVTSLVAGKNLDFCLIRIDFADHELSCGEPGHKARECPTNPTAGNDGKCFNCGQEG